MLPIVKNAGGIFVQKYCKEMFTIPNFLSLVRIILIPFFVFQYMSAEETKDYYLAAIIVLLSGITDLLDGLIARNFNQASEIGKALDPIADKLTQAAIAICLLFRYQFMWILFGLFVIKELFMGINSLILLKRGKRMDGAKWFGKLSTAIFYLAMVFLIAFPNIHPVLATVLIVITGFFLLLSFLLYIPIYINMYQNSK